MSKIKYVVIALKWFDRVNGNTYHSAQILNTESGEFLFVPFQYGYGDQYRQSAREVLFLSGKIPVNNVSDVSDWERENDYPIYYFEQDVSRKRDCVAHGGG